MLVSDEELCWLQCQEDNPDYPEGLLMRADEYLLIGQLPCDRDTGEKYPTYKKTEI